MPRRVFTKCYIFTKRATRLMAAQAGAIIVGIMVENSGNGMHHERTTGRRSTGARGRLAACVLAALLAPAICAAQEATPAARDAAVHTDAQSQASGKLALGAFTMEGELASVLSVRGAAFRAPAGGSFADYLKSTMQSELVDAGLFDGAADAIVSAELLQNDIDADSGCASAAVRVHFVVMRGARKRYDKILIADGHWDAAWMTSYAGAAPAVRQNYAATVKRLIEHLLADPDFRRAI